MTTCGHKATDWRTDKKTSLLWNRDIYWFFPIYSYVFIIFVIFVIFQKSYDITSYNSVPGSTVLRKSICWMLCYDFDNHFLFHRNDAASICLEEISLIWNFIATLLSVAHFESENYYLACTIVIFVLMSNSIHVKHTYIFNGLNDCDEE